MLQPLIWGVAFSIIAFYGLKPFGGMKSPLISVALFAICGLSIGILITLVKRYVSLDNPNKVKVTDILKNIEVSDMRCIPVEVRGVVVGRGTVGWQFDPDFYLKDESGLIYIHHDRIKPFSNIVFAMKTLNKYMDKTVVIKGWYRRFPTPFIELQSIDDEILNPKKGRLLFWKSLATFALILTFTFTWFDQSESIPFSSMSSLSFTSIIDIKGKQMTCIVDQMKKEYSDFPGTVDGVAFAELMNDKTILRVTLPVANSSKKVSDNYFIEFISDSEQGWENSFGSFLTTKVKSKANVFDNKNNKLFVLNLLPCKEEL